MSITVVGKYSFCFNNFLNIRALSQPVPNSVLFLVQKNLMFFFRVEDNGNSIQKKVIIPQDGYNFSLG